MQGQLKIRELEDVDVTDVYLSSIFRPIVNNEGDNGLWENHSEMDVDKR